MGKAWASVDVGKGFYRARVIDGSGEALLSRRVENEEGLEEALGDGWPKAPKLDEYAPRRAGTQALQQARFPYAEAL